ncbi:hypothetical protein [Pseudomonas mosselii]|uniref:hypothetical protein n=1 Tax=Pseudomonas mosselii TaxID=78327 RepID=UPI0015E8D3B7|nr:hypothetical protein [Pseudomonas mosselii]
MKQKTITQSLSWLHAWSGLLFGWMLFAIFLIGTPVVAAWRDVAIRGAVRPGRSMS